MSFYEWADASSSYHFPYLPLSLTNNSEMQMITWISRGWVSGTLQFEQILSAVVRF
mgnify:CR=1 FL=1